MMIPELPTPSPQLNKDGYPVNWPDIAKAIKDWAGGCENCGRVVLGMDFGVHHLDMVKTHCQFTNLIAVCRACHLRIQVAYKPGQTWMFDRPKWAIIRGL